MTKAGHEFARESETPEDFSWTRTARVMSAAESWQDEDDEDSWQQSWQVEEIDAFTGRLSSMVEDFGMEESDSRPLYSMDIGVIDTDYHMYVEEEIRSQKRRKDRSRNAIRNAGFIGAALNLWKPGKCAKAIPFKCLSALLWIVFMGYLTCATLLIVAGSGAIVSTSNLNQTMLHCDNTTVINHDMNITRTHQKEWCQGAKDCYVIGHFSVIYGAIGMVMMILTSAYTAIRATRSTEHSHDHLRCILDMLRLVGRVASVACLVWGTVSIIPKWSDTTEMRCGNGFKPDLITDYQEEFFYRETWLWNNLGVIFWTLVFIWANMGICFLIAFLVAFTDPLTVSSFVAVLWVQIAVPYFHSLNGDVVSCVHYVWIEQLYAYTGFDDRLHVPVSKLYVKIFVQIIGVFP